ncbi:MAG: DHH family phosphoesterase [Thermoplasmata archaeon]|nr:DHH family phosphoesterase [Thermoplasmata archaeon]
MPDVGPATMTFSASHSRRLEEASSVLKSHKGQVRIISHYDPDGISSAAIACQMVKRLGLGFQATLSKNLDDAKLEEIRANTPENHLIIFSDMGSSIISQLEEFPHKIIVVDHHQPEKEGEKIIHLNPHLFGIDGARETSASSFMMSLAITVDEANWNLVGLGLAGAVGDRQDLGGFKGYNEDLVQTAVSRELLKLEITPNLKGQTIYDSFIENPEPYFAGITGRKRETSRFLKWLGLGKETKLADLDAEKKKFLTSICVLRLLRQGATPEAVGELITTRFWLYDWGLYADELSALFNSCSRQGEHSLGLAMALGDVAAREKAIEHSRLHKEFIIQNLRELEAAPPKPMKNIQYFKTSETNYAGVLAGLGTLYFFDNSKATFGMAEKEGEIHVSARAPRTLVKAGLNLGMACKLATEKIGGMGGGHDIAAGATFPIDGEKKFLKDLDRIVGEQLSSNN